MKSLRRHTLHVRESFPFAMILLMVSAALSGCNAIPDLGPFVEATAAIDLAVNQTHDFVVADLNQIIAQAPDNNAADTAVRQSIESARDGFSQEWKVRMEATEAMVAYSASLASIAEAGMNGAASARAMAGSLNSFLSAIPTSTIMQIPAAAIDVAAWIKGEVDKARAARSLAESIEKSHDSISKIGGILVKDFATVGSKINTNVIVIQALAEYHYGDRITYRDSLVEREAALIATISVVALASSLPSSDVAELNTVQELIAQTNDWHEAYLEQYFGAARRGQTEKELIARAAESVRRWAKLHGELGTALREKRVPSAAVLANKALELKDLIDKLRSDDK